MVFVIPAQGGTSFESDDDVARLIVSGKDTDGLYSLLEWTIAANTSVPDVLDYGPHLHRETEETFHIMQGSLEFLIGEEVVTLDSGDFVRVPKGTKHGYINVSGEPVKMLVSFCPGGFEELFLKYRTDLSEKNVKPDTQTDGFVVDATQNFSSEFGLPNPTA